MKNLAKKSLAFVAISVFAMPIWAVRTKSALSDDKKTSSPALEVELAPSDSATYTKSRMSLEMTFKNISDKPIRLLRVFKPTSAFFKISSIIDRGGTLVVVPQSPVNPNKEENLLRSAESKYLDLEAGESFITPVDISKLLPTDLKEGIYNISLIYQNEFGENCFKGTKTIEGIWVTLVEESVENVPGSISKEKAINIAKAAIAGKITLQEDDKVAVRNTASQYIITFGGTPPTATAEITRVGGDFAARVYVNRLTGKIEKIKVSA